MQRLSETELGKLHRIQLQMMKDFDDLCRRNQIQYFLAGGTLLGAVRHHGFIPWDDDVDLMMLREEYEKLCRLPVSEFPNHFFLQTVQTDPEYHGEMAKILLNGTIYQTEFYKNFSRMHQGIFLDIFVHDKTAKTHAGQKVHIFFTALLRSLVLHKWENTPMQYYGKHKIWCRIFTWLNQRIPMGFWQALREKAYTIFKNSHSPNLYDGMGFHLSHGSFPESWLKKTVYLEFEGEYFPAPWKYDEYLRFLYSDYQVIPSIAEQKNHKIFKIDFGSY